MSGVCSNVPPRSQCPRPVRGRACQCQCQKVGVARGWVGGLIGLLAAVELERPVGNTVLCSAAPHHSSRRSRSSGPADAHCRLPGLLPSTMCPSTVLPGCCLVLLVCTAGTAAGAGAAAAGAAAAAAPGAGAAAAAAELLCRCCCSQRACNLKPGSWERSLFPSTEDAHELAVGNNAAVRTAGRRQVVGICPRKPCAGRDGEERGRKIGDRPGSQSISPDQSVTSRRRPDTSSCSGSAAGGRRQQGGKVKYVWGAGGRKVRYVRVLCKVRPAR